MSACDRSCPLTVRERSAPNLALFLQLFSQVISSLKHIREPAAKDVMLLELLSIVFHTSEIQLVLSLPA